MELQTSTNWDARENRSVTIIDNETGELVDDNAYLVNKRVPRGRDYWWRFMVCDLISIMEDLPGKQMHAISAVLDSVSPYDNTIQLTQKEIAEKAGCSPKTMNTAMQVLKNHGVIKMVHRGLWMINPRFMSQGGGARKHETLAIHYSQAGEVIQMPTRPQDDQAAQG